MMRKTWLSGALIACLVCAHPRVVAGGNAVIPALFSTHMRLVSLPVPAEWGAAGRALRLGLESFGPDGRRYTVKDNRGRSAWILKGGDRVLRLRPSVSNYAGPLKLTLNGRLVDCFSPFRPNAEELFLEKILSLRAGNGTTFRVHYTDFSLEAARDPKYPERILLLAKKSYDTLTKKLGFRPLSGRRPFSLDIYLGDTEGGVVFPFDGVRVSGFRRAPFFIIRKDVNGRKSPAILLPDNYSRFRARWAEINGAPAEAADNGEADLAGSIMHEMTHALLHGYHENLGSTEYEIRGGDWYTEGLARFYETKVGSLSGFSSRGSRRMCDRKLRFSRGGANYYLEHPDASFFSLRYENALFWFYFEKRFGSPKIVELTALFAGIPFKAPWTSHMEVLKKVTGVPFETLADDYFNWVYRGDYRGAGETRYLSEAARTRTVWSRGRFRFLGARAGDTTLRAGIHPLAFDAHEIHIRRGGEPRMLILRNLGTSRHLRATVYLYGKNGFASFAKTLSSDRSWIFKHDGLPGANRIGMVLANLDSAHDASYGIELK